MVEKSLDRKLNRKINRKLNHCLDRKSVEALLMAGLAISAIAALRLPMESAWLIAMELLAIFGCVLLPIFFPARRAISLAALIAIPICSAIIGRMLGAPAAFELTTMTMLGVGALCLANQSGRMQGMSLVSSGFLTMFIVTASDSGLAILFAVVWISLCVWHLVANQWERLELSSVQAVKRSAGVRLLSVLAALAICTVGGLLVHGLVGDSIRLDDGFMPFSGGSKWSDDAARDGVGSGDRAIAAKDQAESFGAVESDIFLESTEPSLFDMFNDTIGEPKLKVKQQRAQGLAPEKVIEQHSQIAKSEKSGNSFSVDRLPPKKHQHFSDVPENAVVQWDGPTGIRLAMHRFDSFDGQTWTSTTHHRNDQLTPLKGEDAMWFFDPKCLADGREPNQDSTDVNLLKVIRLDSVQIPAPMATSGFHIKDVDREDFFGISDDGSFYMPGREKIPQLTVINVASEKLWEDDLWQQLNLDQPTDSQQATLQRLADQWTEGLEHPLEKLQAIIARLRSEFEVDRGVETLTDDPVAEFLETRRGGEHLFATTAALMARQVGCNSRLVTGFYVRPWSTNVAAGHANVLPTDVHTWAEVQLKDGRWFELEPSPGYREPVYKPSVWLMTKRFCGAYWIHGLGLLLMAGLIYRTRLFWIELGLSLLYPLGSLVWPSGRMSLAMRVLQTRGKLAGVPRAVGCPQRDWLLSLTATDDSVHQSASRFCDAADQAAFARQTAKLQDDELMKELLVKLKTKNIRRLAMGRI